MTSSNQIERKAERLARELGLSSVPIAVERIAQKLGLSIQEEDFGDEISGLLVLREGTGTIGVNSGHALVRRRFTIAHEIGHFLLHATEGQLFIDHKKSAVFLRDSNSSTGERRQEVEANAFAAALLMPRSSLNELLVSQEVGVIDDESLASMAETLGVSVQALSLRLGRLGLLEHAD